MMENSCRSRRYLPPARSTTTCCRPRCGSFSAARPSRPSRFHRCRPTAGSRTLRTKITLSPAGRLAIDPTNDPSVLTIRWFGSRHVLHVPAKRPFTAHEVRLARALGAVLASRYRAIFDPKQMLERGELFRGSIEDRYVAAFLDAAVSDQAHARADLIATAIE